VRGAARDALAAVHNLEVLLRNAGIADATLQELMPELRGGAATLRTRFDSRRPEDGDAATPRVVQHGLRQVGELDDLLDAIAGSRQTREELAGRASALAYELEASEGLLSLLDRTAAPVTTEVGLRQVVTEAGRGAARGREIRVRFDAPTPDGLVTTDPHLLGPVVALLVSHVASGGDAQLAVRARTGAAPEIVVEAAGPADDAFPLLRMRVAPWIASSELAVRRIAERLGARLTLDRARASVVLDRGA
jgi:hypothetical protein